jgi:quinol monooxygenase YgiN
MGRFAQHTRLVAVAGRQEQLIAKFVDAAATQAGDPACELTLISSTPDHSEVVYLTEVWTSEDAWRRARDSNEIQAWAEGMSALVASPPKSTRLDVRGGKALPTSARCVSARSLQGLNGPLGEWSGMSREADA